MPTPTTTHSVETFFAFIEYTGAALHADPKTCDLETLVTTANDKLGKVVAVPTEAQRHVNRATAVRDFSFRAGERRARGRREGRGLQAALPQDGREARQDEHRGPGERLQGADARRQRPRDAARARRAR